MTESKSLNWRNVVDCAISNSYHKNKSSIPQIQLDSIHRYILSKEIHTLEDSKNIISKSIERAKEQVVPDGCVHTWAKIGIVIGILGIASSVFNLIYTGFSFFFILFLVVAICIIKPCVKCIRTEKGNAQAARIWNQVCLTGDPEQLELTLHQMESLVFQK